MGKTILETERLSLREITYDDADDLALILCDAETMQYYPRPLDRYEINSWIERIFERYKLNGHGLWAVILKAESRLIGDCGLMIQEVDGIDELEVGYQFNKQFWGHGYATEAARGCMDYAANTMGRNRIISMIRPENNPSRRVAERNGLKIEKLVHWRDYDHYVYVSEV